MPKMTPDEREVARILGLIHSGTDPRIVDENILYWLQKRERARVEKEGTFSQGEISNVVPIKPDIDGDESKIVQLRHRKVR